MTKSPSSAPSPPATLRNLLRDILPAELVALVTEEAALAMAVNLLMQSPASPVQTNPLHRLLLADLPAVRGLVSAALASLVAIMRPPPPPRTAEWPNPPQPPPPTSAAQLELLLAMLVFSYGLEPVAWLDVVGCLVAVSCERDDAVTRCFVADFVCIACEDVSDELCDQVIYMCRCLQRTLAPVRPDCTKAVTVIARRLSRPDTAGPRGRRRLRSLDEDAELDGEALDRMRAAGENKQGEVIQLVNGGGWPQPRKAWGAIDTDAALEEFITIGLPIRPSSKVIDVVSFVWLYLLSHLQRLREDIQTARYALSLTPTLRALADLVGDCGVRGCERCGLQGMAAPGKKSTQKRISETAIADVLTIMLDQVLDIAEMETGDGNHRLLAYRFGVALLELTAGIGNVHNNLATIRTEWAASKAMLPGSVEIR